MRDQNYYDGATSDKSFFDKLIDHFLSRWFSTRHSDTKLIWEESSLKGLLCVWQRDGIVKQNAIIKVKDSLDKEYTLERMCTDQDLIKNFKQDILVKVRSTGKLLNAKVNFKKDNSVEVNLKEFEDGISPGQACVFYALDQKGYKVLGGGWIKD